MRANPVDKLYIILTNHPTWNLTPTTPHIYDEITAKNWKCKKQRKHNLVKELQFNGETFQQYFRFTRDQFAQVLCYVEEDCCLSFWNPAKLFGKDLSLTSYSGFPIQFCTKVLHESFHEAFPLTSNTAIRRCKANSMPHPDILKSSHPFTLFFFCCNHILLIWNLKADIPYKQYICMQHCSIHAFLGHPLLNYFPWESLSGL